MSEKTNNPMFDVTTSAYKAVSIVGSPTIYNYAPDFSWVGSNIIESLYGKDRRFRPVRHSVSRITTKYQYADGMWAAYGGPPPVGPFWDVTDVSASGNPPNDGLTSIVCGGGYIAGLAVPYMVSPPSAVAMCDTFEWGVWGTRGMDSLYKRISTTETSIVNFLLELDEVADMYMSFKRKRELYLKRKANPIKAHKPLVRKPIRIKPSANAYLTVQFGILPLVGDLQAIAKVLLGLQQRVEEMKKAALTPQTIHYNMEFTSTTTEDNKLAYVEQRGNHGYCPLRIFRTRTQLAQKYVLTLRYNVVWKQLSGAEAVIRSMLSSFGVGSPATILWNAIPYTFVIDYFIDVSGILDSLFKGEIEPYHIEVLDCCQSVKTRNATNLSVYYEGAFFPNALTETTEGYVRRVGVPSWDYKSVLARSRLPKLKQLLNIAALAASHFGEDKEVRPKWKTSYKWLNFGKTLNASYYYTKPSRRHGRRPNLGAQG